MVSTSLKPYLFKCCKVSTPTNKIIGLQQEKDSRIFNHTIQPVKPSFSLLSRKAKTSNKTPPLIHSLTHTSLHSFTSPSFLSPLFSLSLSLAHHYQTHLFSMAFHKPFFLFLHISFTFLCFPPPFTSVVLSTPPTDVELLLYKIKPTLQGNTESLLLSSWNSSTPLCQWRGLKWVFSNGTSLNCDTLSSPFWSSLSLYRDPSLHLLSLQLPSANLSGSIPRELGQLSALQTLYLSVNSLSQGVPLEIGYSSSLTYVDLGQNLLSGSLSPSIWNLCDRLISLRLHGNALSGSLPSPALPNSSCDRLRELDFGDNKFSGLFPDFITRFTNLKVVDLSDNMFSGAIPDGVAHLQLDRLNLSYNNFSGLLPNFGESKFGAEAFAGNNVGLCGYPLRSCNDGDNMSPGSIAGLVIGLMTGSVVTMSILIGYLLNRRKNREENEDDLEEFEEDETAGETGEAKLIVFQGGENLTLDDVLNATGQVIEKTSYGTSYKAKLADGGTIALRLLREGCCKDRSSCLPVVKQLGRLRHENLDPLRAFYQGKRGEKLLIYDYVPTRTLFELLHGKFQNYHDFSVLYVYQKTKSGCL